jgi:hypothetical protein
MAGTDHASESEHAPDNDAPRRATTPEQKAGETASAAGVTPVRAAAPANGRSLDTGSLGARQVRARMVAGAATDPAERAADHAADQVLRMAAPEQNRPAAVDPTVAGASSQGPGKATSVPPEPQRPPAGPGPAAAPAPAAPAPAAAAPAVPAPSAAGPAVPVHAAAVPAAPTPAASGPAVPRSAAQTPTIPVSTAAGPPAPASAPAAPVPASAGSEPAASAAGAAPVPAAAAAAPVPASAPTALAMPATAGGAAPAPARSAAPAPVIQREPVADHDPHHAVGLSAETERYLDQSQGIGSPLPDGTRTYFEARFSTDFRAVRVHDDDAADQAARSIGAIAFTRGNDIWFSAGAYDPVTDEGRRLLAHELAHIAQQHPGIGRRVDERVTRPAVRKPRAAKKPRPADSPSPRRSVRRQTGGAATTYTSTAPPIGTIDTTAKTLKFKTLPVPGWKAPFSTQPLTWRKPAEGRPNDQRSIWIEKVRDQSIKGVKDRVQQLRLRSAPYYLQGHAASGESNFFYTGSAEDIGTAIAIPPWENSKSFDFRLFDVDHKKEWQLGGLNEIGNMWLLDRHSNRSSGSTIMHTINDQVDAYLLLAKKVLSDLPEREELHNKYTVTFESPKGEGPGRLPPNYSWEREDIGTDAHVGGLEQVPDDKLAHVKGKPDRLVIYQRPGGGRVRRIPLRGRTGDPGKWSSRGYKVTSVSWTLDGPSPGSGPVGEIVADVFKKKKLVEDVELKVPILGMPGVDYGGFIDPETISRMRSAVIKAKPFSPIDFADLEFDLDKGLVGRGVIPTPSIKLLEKVQIAVVLDEGEVGIEAEIDASELRLPGPFKVKGGALTLTAKPSGLSVAGRVDFEIQGLATGFIGAAATTAEGGGFALEGALDFDTKMFTQAHLGLSYRDGHFGVDGILAVGQGKIAGIQSASVKVTVEDERVDATGDFTPSMRGLEHGQLGFKYDPATGSEITGSIQLSAGLPGIRGGALQGRIAQRPGGQGYSLTGDITLQPSIPGVASDIHGHYEDGAFLVEADVGYKRGMLDGSVHIGVTNQVPGADGRPAGPPTSHLTVFGGGEVTIRIAPWLQGRVGLKLQPNGELIVTGEVSLPDQLDVFPEYRLDKNIFTIGLDIPIVGVAVLGQRIGIFATIRGGLDVSAGFGPGQLRNVAVRVTYNPSRESDTRIEGSAAFHVPAHAGLRLFVQGGLGAGIPIVSATAGLEVSGALGLEGAADDSVNLAWTPARGLVLNAKGEIYVEPKFRFAITGFVDVSADVWVHTYHLYEKRWQLAAFEYGSNLRFGVVFPIHYEEGHPFHLSLDQVQFTYPTIDAKELLAGLIGQIA